MINITHKNNTLRKAISKAILQVSNQLTIDAIKNNLVPKGNVFEMAKAAGLLAIKNTSNVIPDCHPLPIEFAKISYHIIDLTIDIEVEVHTIYKTGVEVEAMHGASIVALTMYDMLKPIDKHIEIKNISLMQKKGGKSDFKNQTYSNLKTAIIVCSDSISSGKKEDKAGKSIIEKLASFHITQNKYIIIPDEFEIIQNQIKDFVAKHFDMIILTGGTGLSKRDVTPEAVKPLLDREIPGIMEASRSYGQNRTPYAMLSRSVAGMIGKTLVLALPGSTKGASESMDALFPHVLHIFAVAEGLQHKEV